MLMSKEKPAVAAERDAAHSQSVYDAAIDQSPVIFYAAEPDTKQRKHPRITFISPNVERITGHKVQALLGEADALAKLMHADDVARYRQTLSTLRKSNKASAEYRLQTDAGAYRWFRDAMELKPAEEGGKPEIVGCLIDISEEKRTEAALRDAATLRDAITNAALDAIVVVDENGLIVEVNPVAEETFGFRRDVAVGKPMSELIVPEKLRAKHLAGMKRFLETGETRILGQVIETEAMRADGTIFPIEICVTQLVLGGRPVFLAVLWDTTERRDARQERQRLSQLLRDAVESIPNGFAIYSATERLILCNRAYAALYGEEPEEMVGTSEAENYRRAQHHLALWDGKPVDDSEAGISRSLERLQRADGEPIELQLKNGEWKQLTSHTTGDGGRVYVRTDITWLKQAEASLRESEEQFRAIVEGSPTPVRVADLETTEILYESPAAAATVGRPWPSKGRFWASENYVDEDSRQHMVEMLHREGRIDNFETRLKRADGTVFWVSISSRVIGYRGKQVVVTGFVDLTENKQREADLRQARETLEDAIESLAEGFALYDADDRLLMCNQQYRSYNPLSADLLVPGVKWEDFLRIGGQRGQYVDAIGRVEEWVEERKQQRTNQMAGLEFQQSDGRWYRFSNLRTRQGGVVVTRTDITSNKEMEQALRESEALIRHVVESNPLPVGMTRCEDGLIIYESPACKKLFGRAQDAPPGTRITDFYVNEEDRDRFLKELRSTGAIDNFEVELRRQDGTRFWAAISSRMIDYQGEEVSVASLVDLTERRAVEQEMERQREALHQSEKLGALGSLLAGVAHELNNPLSVVVGQSLLLKETAADTKIAERAAKIGNAADRCSRIVRSFLAMARQQPSEPATVNLNDIVEETLEVIGYALRTADIDLKLDLARDLPPVWADADQLNQVITNLIVNAQQAMSQVSGKRRLKITSGWNADKGVVLLAVKDSGPGIPPEIRSRIFEPFFTTKPVGEGTGVGLAVCHRIVETLHGRIFVRSRPGVGATFTISLPMATSEWQPAAAEPEDQADTGTCKVLVIDDEADVIQMLTDILKADGHEVRAAESGKKAMSLLSRHEFDIVLSDLRMPEMDGPQLYELLSELSPKLAARVAFITGDTFSPSVNEFLTRSGRPYIQKPFTPVEVRELIARVLAERQHPAGIP
ncbi:MAG: PAS domain S-box protein [Alphaproteobacteria bacterium]|nr:PAS domain S-box protein [Alphaproteobacteria bacterium]